MNEKADMLLPDVDEKGSSIVAGRRNEENAISAFGLPRQYYQEALAAFDRANAEDPDWETDNGVEYPKELLYAWRIAEMQERYVPNASEAVRLACRARHIRRWMCPRSSFPMDPDGHLQWRAALYKFQAEIAGNLMKQAGCGDEMIRRVLTIISEKAHKVNPETQLMEDVADLVFIEHYMTGFIASHPEYDETTRMEIISKTWNRMSFRAHDFVLAGKLRLPEALAPMILKMPRKNVDLPPVLHKVKGGLCGCASSAPEGAGAGKVLAADEDGADAILRKMLANEDNVQRGEVFLVGAGPGDPDLLTFRALRLMRKADAVVYDNLVSKSIVEMTRLDAERIYVGKKSGDHTLPQEHINALLVRLSREGKCVVRLKGGDPFIFGRGGEEIETLAAEGIPFQVVPGVTAASGVASYAGIPLTHRDYAQSCLFVTGHLQDGTMNLDWAALARPRQTVVVYMGLHGLDTLCSELIGHGMPGTTPVAIVQQGATQNQRVFTGTLETLPGIAEREKPQAPSLIIVGGVVSLREKLAWFHPHPSAT